MRLPPPPLLHAADDLVFLEEDPVAPILLAARNVWRVMIVDDDQDVHSTTTFALADLDMQQRPLEFLHAYSAGQARELLKHEQDIAVILLDVVMEQDDAGLHLVRYIRKTLKLADVRIILRTGQPGYAPEIDAIRDFDINDYKTKSELTRVKLYTTVTAAIRSYQQIRCNDELLNHLHHTAFYDQLSKLPNRSRMVEILETSLAGPARDKTTLALIDLDHFAETNDALGHQFGDLLLQAVGHRLQSRFARELAVARLGGDIFSVLGDAQEVNPARILALFDTPFYIDGQQVQLSATLGLVRLGEHDGSAADALKDADIALKRAKSLQRAGHFYFSRSMGVEIRERVRMMHGLRNAFGQKQLFVVYQPQINLATRRPVGAEALLRWQTPDGKFISPERFIPIAEYSGLIIDLGEWVLRTACHVLVALRAQGHDDFMMSINVSQVQFRHPRFLEMLRSVLADTQAPPEFIELELTESIAMEEPERLIEMLAQIKHIGVSTAIDDFGTGFSSLSYLQRLRIDRIKIDRAFVSEITNAARSSSIAEMVIQLGRKLGQAVIAEGVEDEHQARILQSLGCPLAQGFLFARPMTATALGEWLSDDALEGAA